MLYYIIQTKKERGIKMKGTDDQQEYAIDLLTNVIDLKHIYEKCNHVLVDFGEYDNYHTVLKSLVLKKEYAGDIINNLKEITANKVFYYQVQAESLIHPKINDPISHLKKLVSEIQNLLDKFSDVFSWRDDTYWLLEILHEKNLSLKQFSKMTEIEYKKLTNLITKNTLIENVDVVLVYHLIHTLKLDINAIYNKYKLPSFDETETGLIKNYAEEVAQYNEMKKAANNNDSLFYERRENGALHRMKDVINKNKK